MLITPSDYTPEMLAPAETIGLIMQVVLLVVAVISIEWFIGKGKKEGYLGMRTK
jgi:hypothetical protein